jgi:hypothetical protein
MILAPRHFIRIGIQVLQAEMVVRSNLGTP